jgi:hypothetical protein
MFCNESTLKFLKFAKFDLSAQEVKELGWLLQKHREGISTCFLNLGSLFYTKEEREVQTMCATLLSQMKDKVTLHKSHSLKLEDKIKEMDDTNQQ